jgi:hypothetical protein
VDCTPVPSRTTRVHVVDAYKQAMTSLFVIVARLSFTPQSLGESCLLRFDTHADKVAEQPLTVNTPAPAHHPHADTQRPPIHATSKKPARHART